MMPRNGASEVPPGNGDPPRLVERTILVLLAPLRVKDQDTYDHCLRVGRLAASIGESLRLDVAQQRLLHQMGLAHDVGKTLIPEQILGKRGRLTAEEMLRMQRHVGLGVGIVTSIPGLAHLAEGISQHHERWDGTGYPDGLAGGEIGLAGRILAVADSYDAMWSTRCYRHRPRPAAEIEAVFAADAADGGRQWDPRIVAALFARRAALERLATGRHRPA